MPPQRRGPLLPFRPPAIQPRSPVHPPSPDLIPITELPVEETIESLRHALADSLSAVLVAPPGAGKTTIVPLRLLDEPWLDDRRIVMLEPRRLAARAAARRLSHLIGQHPGELIGYQTRDERVIGPRTRIEIVTEGILTRRLQNDPAIDGVGLVIFDEVHERNLPTDLGLAFCLDVRRTIRPDLRILAMSATPDADLFARALGIADRPAPVIRSEGRTFDVDIVWAPVSRDQKLDTAVVTVIRRALREHVGDVLVFLPGIAEIERVRRALSVTDEIDVVPLAGALTLEEQDRALTRSPDRRRVVLSTDIAETSLTVDGIRIVVDAGQARIPRFDTRTGMTRLVTVPASRASCDQRSGRAGRVEPGVAYRLWSKLEHGTRRAHLDPEISQADLASFALDLALWGTPVADLTFLQAPPMSALEAARELLEDLGALEGGGITALGRTMLGLPVHPRLAKMILAAEPQDRSLACLLAVVIDERDIMRGPLDTKPVDLTVRIDAVLGRLDSGDLSSNPPDAGAVRRLRTRSDELARRAGTVMDWACIDPERAAALVLLAYPDRLAIRRQPGQFQLANGSAAWVPRTDPLAQCEFLVAVDLDGNRKTARIRLGLAVHEHDLYKSMGDDLEEERFLRWDKERGDIFEHAVVRLGNLKISERMTRPIPCDETSKAIFDHLAQRRFSNLLATSDVRALCARVEFLRRTFSADSRSAHTWPDWSQTHLITSAHEWFEPHLVGMTSVRDAEALNVSAILLSTLPWDVRTRLDELAPVSLELATGRSVPIEYARTLEENTAPTIDVRVQDLFGTRTHPTIADGRVRLVLRLLSPADRPIQVTSDLVGFWSGSWTDVRKELAGRYPKHNWPADPASADPKRLKGR